MVLFRLILYSIACIYLANYFFKRINQVKPKEKEVNNIQVKIESDKPKTEKAKTKKTRKKKTD